MVKYLPRLEWGDIDIKRIKSYRADSADYQIRVSFKNTGKLPTALRQADLVKIVAKDRVVLDFSTAPEAEGKNNYRIIGESSGNERGRGSRMMYGDAGRTEQRRSFSKEVPFTEGGKVTTAVFTIRLFTTEPVKGSASVLSTRGGVLRGRIEF